MSGLRRDGLGLAGLLGAALILLSLAYLPARPFTLDIGGPYDDGHLSGFYQRETTPDGAAYRWSSGASTLSFPGLGLAPASVGLQLSSGRVAGSAPVPVQVFANGQPLTTLTLTTDSRLYTVAVPAAGIDALSGDLTLAFRSPTDQRPRDSRHLGFIADSARVAPQDLTWPAPAPLFYLLAGLALLYWLIRWLGWRGWVALAFCGGLALGEAAVLVGARMWLTVFSGQLFGLLLVAHLAARGVGWATGAGARWALPGRLWPVTHPGWCLLLSLFAAAFLLKVGGLLYPHSALVDADFHLRLIRLLVAGQFPEQHQLALLVMPADEWKHRVFIPYSPVFYYAFAPLAALPWPLEQSVPAVMGFLDVLRIPLVFLLGLRLGPGLRRALAGAAVFTVVPATYALQQWGNWPTQLSLWFLLAWLVVVVLAWERLHRPLPFLLASGLLALALVAYTVTAAYIGLIFGGFLVLGLIFVRGQRRAFTALLVSSLLGLGLALLGFYGPYVGEVLTGTLPALLHASGAPGDSGGSVTTRTGGLAGFLIDSAGKAIQSYGLAGVFGLGLAGFGLAVVEWWQRRRAGGAAELRPARSGWAFGLLLAWVLSLPLFTAADYVVDQALKEYWFALPAWAVLGGAWLLVSARRGRAGALLVDLLGVALAWNSLSLWVFRLLLHNRGF